MHGRKYEPSADKYRHGFNGQEKDDEIFNGAYTAEYWEYDSRTGRRWNRDPITYAGQSPYATFNNNPVYFKDPSGAKGEPPIKKGETVDLGNGQTFKSSFDEVAVEAKKPSIFKQITNSIVNPLKYAWKKFVEFDNYLGSQKEKSDFTPAVKTNLSGLEQTGEGPHKGVAFSTRTGHVETVTGYNPGEILMSVGGGVVPKAEYAKSLREALENIKNFSYDYVTGGDYVEKTEDVTKPMLEASNSDKTEKQSVKTQKQTMSVPELFLFIGQVVCQGMLLLVQNKLRRKIINH